MPSGVKRPWESQGGLPYSNEGEGDSKRLKESHREKDRRDSLVDSHGKNYSQPGRSPRSGRDERRPHGYRRDKDHHDDHYRSRKSDYRDERKDRDRDRRRDRSRDRHRERDRGRGSSRSKRQENGHDRHRSGKSKPKEDKTVEREEGEISSVSSVSSRSSTPTRRRSRSRSYSTSRRQSPPKTDTEPTSQQEPEPELELTLATTPPPVEEILAKRRAQREAILAKYKTAESGVSSVDGTPGGAISSTALPPPPSVTISKSDVHTPQTGPAEQQPATPSGVPDGTRSPSGSPEPDHDFSLAKDDGDASQTQSHPHAEIDPSKGVDARDQEQVSAADYDPNVDRQQEEARRVWAAAKQDGRDVDMQDAVAKQQEVEEVEEEVEEDDDIDDMFAVDTAPKKKVKKVKTSKTTAPALVTTTLDAAADPEGYYQVILGEQLDGGRYQVFSSLGKGMFSNVVRARILSTDVGDVGKEVAIKIVRAQETMYKAGLKEIQILKKLMEADPDDRRHLIRLERTFEHRGHLCLVFESMSMNLREIVKRFGKDVGLNIRAVRAYAHQIFLALSLLKKANIMHADIKPDNILVNESKSMLKICDLGSASDVSENDITPYLVSRFYRAPEIIIGLPYDTAIDTWSVGCTLYELYTGKILFPGRSNNQMLLHMMELKGRFNSKMVKKAQFGSTYFDDMGGFESIEEDKVTGGVTTRKVHVSKPIRDLRARLMPSSVKLKEEEMKTLGHFVDLLDKCLALDPARRITAKEALMHPFVRG